MYGITTIRSHLLTLVVGNTLFYSVLVTRSMYKVVNIAITVKCA